MTYFIQAEDGGPVKIGRTTSENGLRSRLTSLQIGNPSILVVRRTLVGTGHERELHLRFAHLRLVGEWFYVDDELATISHAIKGTVADPEDTVGYQLGYQAGFTEGMLKAHDHTAKRLAEFDAAMAEDRAMLADDMAVYADDSRRSRPRTAHGIGPEREGRAA